MLFALLMLSTGCQASTVGSAQTSTRPVQGGWKVHRDASFSVNLPQGWTAGAVSGQGAVELSGSGGEAILIAPVFVPAALQATSASALLRSLSSQALPEARWQTIEAIGPGAVRMIGQWRDRVAVSGLTFKAAPRGTSAMMFLASTRSEKYAASADTIAAILDSFVLFSDSNRPARQQTQYVRWQDPRERSFTLEAPQGWGVQGGAVRPNTLVVQAKAEAVSPDGEIYLYLGDNFPVYVEPNQLLAFAGIGPGGIYRDPMGGSSPVQYYAPGVQYFARYVMPQRYGNAQIVDRKDRSDLARSLPTAGINRFDAGELDFRFSRNEKNYRGAALCVTEIVTGGAGSLWHVWRLYLVEAPENRFEEASQALVHMAQSFHIDEQWAQMQAGLTARQSGIITEMGNAVSASIRKSHEYKWAHRDPTERGFSNAILGVEDVRDPETGREFRVENGFNHHWINPRGNMAGTQTDTNPSPLDGYRPLLKF